MKRIFLLLLFFSNFLSFSLLFPLVVRRVSDDAGSVSIVKIDEIVQSSLTSDSVFILDIGTEIFVWIGKNSSPVQKKNAMSLAAVRSKFLISLILSLL